MLERKPIQSDLFDVEGFFQEQEKKAAEEKAKKNLEARKQLVLPFFENPKNDNEKLMNFQHDYITNGDESAWLKMWELSYIVARNLLWKYMGEHRMNDENFLDEEAQLDKISSAVEYVLRRYKTRVGYCITTNFITQLNFGIKHVMEYTTKLEKETDSLEAMLENGVQI